MLLMAVYQSQNIIPLWILHFSSSSILHAIPIQLINKKKNERDVYVGFRSFFWSRVSFLFSIFQICWFEKSFEKMSERPYP